MPSPRAGPRPTIRDKATASGELAGCGGDALAKIKNSTVASSVCGAEDGSRPRGVGGNFGGQGGCRMCSQSV